MWKTREEINKTYLDHLDSLKLSRMPYDDAAVRREWQRELDAWDAAQLTCQHPPADVCPGYEGSIGDPDVPPACQR